MIGKETRWNFIFLKTSSSPSWQSSSVADCLSRGAGQNEGGYRWHLKSSRALWPVWPCHAPSFQHKAFQTQLDNNKCRPASEPIRNRASHRGTATWSDPNEIQQHPSYWPIWGGHRGQGQRPRWPLISRHVWTRPHTMRGLKLVIRICGDEGGQEGSELLQASCLHLCVCCWHGDLVSGPQTTGPSLKPPPYLPLLTSPWCAALVSGLFVAGPGGRNYTRDDPVLLGLPAFQVGLSFVGWLWSYSPRSLATSELIPLMSPCTDHQIATIPSLSLHKPARTVCQGHAAQRVKLNHYFVHEVKLWLLLQCNYTQDMLTGSNSSVIKNIWS